MFLDAPQVVLEEARGAVLARFILAGTISLSGSGVIASERQVLFDADIRFTPAATVAAATGASIRLLAAGAALTRFEARNAGSITIPQAVINFLNGSHVRNWLAARLVNATTLINSISPPLLVPFIDQLGVGTLVNLSNVQVKVLDGALAVCIDYSPGEIDIDTDGNLDEVESFLSISDIAICAHPLNRLLMARMAFLEARTTAREQNVEIDSLSIKIGSDHLKIKVHATKDDFGAEVTLRAKILIGTPEREEQYDDEYGGQYVQIIPGTDDIWVDIWDVEVDTELPAWTYLLITAGVFILLPLGPVIIAAIVSVIESIKANVANQIENSGSDTSASRVQRVTLPATSAPFVDITASQIKTSPDGFQTRAWFKPVTESYAGQIAGPNTSTVEELVDGKLSYNFKPDIMLWHPENPLIDIRWQVRRSDTNQVIQSQRLPAANPDALSITVNLNSPNNIASPKYKVNCTPLRRGSPNETIASSSLEVEIKDRLDRTHPFVQWDHSTCVPRVERVKGILRLTGWDGVNRSSKIHKTKLPGRCRMAGQYSPATWPVSLHYSDELPFPADQIIVNRALLCDYCFFGGPDKSEPLPL